MTNNQNYLDVCFMPLSNDNNNNNNNNELSLLLQQAINPEVYYVS
jgi:hypothetical protein